MSTLAFSSSALAQGRVNGRTNEDAMWGDTLMCKGTGSGYGIIVKNKTKWKIMSLLVLPACRILIAASWNTVWNDAAIKHRAYSNRDEIHIISWIIRYAHRGRGGAEMGSRMSAVHEVYRKANTFAPDGKSKPPKLHDPGEQRIRHMGRGTKTHNNPTWMMWRLLWLIIHGSRKRRHECVHKRAALYFYCDWGNVVKRSYSVLSRRWTYKVSLVLVLVATCQGKHFISLLPNTGVRCLVIGGLEAFPGIKLCKS